MTLSTSILLLREATVLSTVEQSSNSTMVVVSAEEMRLFSPVLPGSYDVAPPLVCCFLCFVPRLRLSPPVHLRRLGHRDRNLHTAYG